ncbi:MAG: hypothetical protein HQK54_10335 [Oligoflexales bacterium]|nr:hypothetical protein [Oligoflexales bacterium]
MLRGRFFIPAIFLLTLDIGCVPKYLEKYNKNESSLTPSSSSQAEAGVKRDQSQRKTIYMIDKQTFRFRLGSQQVWDSAISVLMANYNINIIDRSSGVITTEWDTFYNGDQVFRNKISLYVKKQNWDMVDVIIHNNVETLQSSHESAPTWMPAENDQKEVGRIIQNMAAYLNEPVPAMPSEMLAKGAGEGLKQAN